ncbi:hypothetical protein ABQ337_21745, partial [Enterobacter hormaechei]
VFAGKKSAQIREILISESAWEEMTCLFAPSLRFPDRLKNAGYDRKTLSTSFISIPRLSAIFLGVLLFHFS